MSTNNINIEIIHNLIINGDISKLSQAEKITYYKSICERVGLDPLAQPFKILKLNGKEVLYCDRGGAAQLNKLHSVSHCRIEDKTIQELFVVYMKASLPDGRSSESAGAVNIKGLSGESLANAIMKAETKAKRRSTLDLLGLGMLDESEIETIPNLKPVEVKTQSQQVTTTPVALPPPSVTSQQKEVASTVNVEKSGSKGNESPAVVLEKKPETTASYSKECKEVLAGLKQIANDLEISGGSEMSYDQFKAFCTRNRLKVSKCSDAEQKILKDERDTVKALIDAHAKQLFNGEGVIK